MLGLIFRRIRMEKKKNKYLYMGINWIIIFLMCLLLSHKLNIRSSSYYYDAAYYWTTADPVFENGFNFLNFPETFRGYFFPFSISLFKIIFGTGWGWRVYSAFMTSTMFAILLPSFFKRNVFNIKCIVRDVFTTALFLLFWGDFMQYPLSDFAAFFFLIAGFAAAKCLTENNAGAKPRKIILWGLLTGALFYTAYNTRAAYEYAVFFILFFIVIKLKNVKKILSVLLLMFAGALIVALPQCMINKQYVNKFSPKIYTEAINNYSTNLQVQQLFWGMEMDRWESYIGNFEDFPSPEVIFDGKTGIDILNREHISDAADLTLKQLIKIFLKYPFDTIHIYTRHLISLMTPIYYEIYIPNLYTNKIGIISISITLWILAGLAFVRSINLKEINTIFLWVFAGFIPAFLQLFGAPELRFFLPVYVILYEYLGTRVSYKDMWIYYKNKLIPTLLVVLFIVIMWIAIIGEIIGSNEYILLINSIK